MTLPQAISEEKSAWDHYVAYVVSRIPRSNKTFNGDATSNSLFAQWRQKRDVRDALTIGGSR